MGFLRAVKSKLIWLNYPNIGWKLQSFLFYAYRRIELYELDGKLVDVCVCVCVNVRVNGYDECREREKEKNIELFL